MALPKRRGTKMRNYTVTDGIEAGDDYPTLAAALAAARDWAERGTDWERDGTEQVLVRDADNRLVESIPVPAR